MTNDCCCCQTMTEAVVVVSRYYAQKIFFLLMSHEDFDKMMHKYVPSQTLRDIQDKLDTLKKKVSHG